MNIFKNILGVLVISCVIGCNSSSKEKTATIYKDVKIVSAMKNVMWKGELQGKINLDTIADKNGLYGIGPVSYLSGELLINNGNSYVSKVTSDTTMIVEKDFKVTAPFFVYANVTEWTQIELPSNIKTVKDIEAFVDEKTKTFKRPFAFKLAGTLKTATIHIQNLPKGTKVSSPTEAHQGQVNYQLENEEVEIIGFFSTEHKGIFTHHDANIHLHLITKNEDKMGHLDAVTIDKMTLFLPKK
ncbi:acetolactate decarboxylase [Kordia algicida OT-1]|uniref:Alpha-acetolactate decarboxylase n=1 Tax=Kordia algicida OT-1 TaxID=391587 RepID=A9DIA0_9FLAO|nr:acetolactate decarboxylase [Kordia algicida]EDP97861.1 probable decarboxylase [Kordia algicida OT-1]